MTNEEEEISPAVLHAKVRLVGKMAVSMKRSKTSRGTIINVDVFKGAQLPEKDGAAASTKQEIVDGTKVAAASIDESTGEKISTANKVATHVKFGGERRQSIMKQLAVGTLSEPPKKGALKSYNRTSLNVDQGLKELALSGAVELMREDMPDEDQLDVRSYDDEEFTLDEQVEFLSNYGLSQRQYSFVVSISCYYCVKKRITYHFLILVLPAS